MECLQTFWSKGDSAKFTIQAKKFIIETVQLCVNEIAFVADPQDAALFAVV
jgi:hypothetical protein